MTVRVGYVIVEINQGSSGTALFQSRGDAIRSAYEQQQVADAAGRLDRYVPCELIPVVDMS